MPTSSQKPTPINTGTMCHLDAQMGREGIVNLRLTKYEIIQYRVFKKIMTAICCRHVRLRSIKVTMPR
jgi:hypothetical protein